MVGPSIHVCDQEDFNRLWASVHFSYGNFFVSIWQNFQKENKLRYCNSSGQSIHSCNRNDFNSLFASGDCSSVNFLVSSQQNIQSIYIFLQSRRFLQVIRVIVHMENISSRSDRIFNRIVKETVQYVRPIYTCLRLRRF